MGRGPNVFSTPPGVIRQARDFLISRAVLPTCRFLLISVSSEGLSACVGSACLSVVRRSEDRQFGSLPIGSSARLPVD
ncbi:unnamed protein product [Protopolystoma xenopodis]|uniref:Uncharacterized protein n=1 Tax=Protopolystoma xenopodis TaxID=117903 RepID=A0A448X7J0_9PLAT|nr:unnamed protein product [Protopolystoma xenopodis]